MVRIPIPMHTSLSSASLLNESANSKLKSILASTLLPTKLATVCSKAAQELKDACAATGRVDYEEVERLMKAWDVIDEEQARARKEHLLSSFRSVAAETRVASSRPITDKKILFNHEYTPLLDKYFEFNAYPSAADRLVLARKSMMTPRQIEVWFQNHRNRAKKEGKVLRRSKDVPPPSAPSLASLKQTMPSFIVPEHEKPVSQSKAKDDLSDEELVHCSCYDSIPNINHCSIYRPVTASMVRLESDVLDPPRPPHAFPTPYVCSSTEVHMNKNARPRFPAPVWYRTPAVVSCQHVAEVDMDLFAFDFLQKLHLRAPVPKKQCRSPASPWYASRITTPYPAPLPALLQQPLCTTLMSCPSAECPTLQSPDKSMNPPNLPTTDSASPLRQVACLPSCTPSQSIVHCYKSESSKLSRPTSNPTHWTIPQARHLSSSKSSSRSSLSSSCNFPVTPVFSQTVLPAEISSSSLPTTELVIDESDNLFTRKGRSRLPPEERAVSDLSSARKTRWHSHFHRPDQILRPFPIVH